MCLVLIALRAHPRYPLVIAANRDEFYARPTAPAEWWPPEGRVLGGRDLRAGGTWMGMARDGRIALVTNVREGVTEMAPRSRGDLVSTFLSEEMLPRDAIEVALAHGAEYAGFNLVMGSVRELWYGSNRGERVATRIEDGMHGLSNGGLDTPWPKVVRGQAGLERALAADEVDEEALFTVLADEHRPADANLPETGIPQALERVLSSAFIRTPEYGTRSSTVLIVDRSGQARFVERRFGAQGRLGESRLDVALL